MTNIQLFFAITTVVVGIVGLNSTILILYVNHRLTDLQVSINTRFSDLYRYLDLNIKIILDKIEEVEKKINK